MLKKLTAAAALVAGLGVLAPGAASADTYAQVTLNPGERYCAREFYPAYYEARAQGSVLSGHNVRWTFGTYAPSHQKLSDSMTPQPSFYAQANLYTHPSAFPGSFQVCAVNQSLKVSTVFLQVTSY
ncbi:MAG TPA: hypothetical protein VHF27_01590 [Acidimicrobiales bacterium]|nr:hypothetical protein [Acidimicrobiales bacterium]